jgi:ATP-dependent Clp protease ATP-binding subunit ClpC
MKTSDAKLKWLQKLKFFMLGAGKIPFPEADDFEPVARQALEFAPEEARRFRHDFVGTEHLLLGLIHSGSQTVSKVMHKFGISLEAVSREIELFVSTGATPVTAATIPFTPRAREALQLAAEEARRLGQPHVRAEHIFLGLLREGGGVAAVVLEKLNVRLDGARAEILKEMGAHPGAS